MAKITGRDGIVKIGDEAALQTRSWSIDETGDTAESSVMGDPARTFLPTINSWSGSMDVYYDEDDAAIFDNALIGLEVTIEVYPEGEAEGDNFMSGSAIVTGKTNGASFDGMTEGTLSLQGSGALIHDVVPTP